MKWCVAYILIAMGLSIGLPSAFVTLGWGATEQRLLLAAILIPVLIAIGVVTAFKARIRKIPPATPNVRALHAWLGAPLALMMFVISFSGAVALFKPEIHIWESPTARITLTEPFIEVDTYARTLADIGQTHGDIDYIFVSRPRTDKPYFDIAAQVKGKSARRIGTYESRDPHTGKIMPTDTDKLSTWLRSVHSDLSYRKKRGRKIKGRTVLGVLGVFILVILLAGMLSHKHLFRSLFTWRPTAPAPMRWRDTHNALGAWVLVFALVMTATGASIALIKPLIPIVSSLAQNGDLKSARDLVAGEIKPTGRTAEMMNIDSLFLRAATELDGNMPLAVRIINWNDRNAHAIFIWAPTKEITSAAQIKLNAVTGALISKNISEIGGYAGRIDSMLPALHYAKYGRGTVGSLGLRLIYAILGLALAFTSVSGFYYWILKQKLKTKNPKTLRAFSHLVRLTLGICMGMVVATAGIFLTYSLWPKANVAQAYFGIWSVCIIWAFVRDSAFKDMCLMITALCVGAVSMASIPMAIGNTPTHASAIGVNISLIFCAITAWKCYKYTP
ncbi:MAG: hypothetical protein COA69_07605 [Robiginitomaculum sp.]|nr:MAG: hypothetical protein COA69_07605 [Robiginitomaculum sp.]